MKLRVWSAATSLVIAGLMGDYSSAIDRVNWVGGANSNWHAANAWKNNTTNVTGDAAAILGQGNGSDGMNNVDPTQTRARNVVIGGGAQVEYYAPGNGDLRFNQGSSLTVKEGAVLVQETDSTYTANAWTEWDGSNLILDGGTFRRTGNTIKEETGLPDGGGVFMFGSWRSDANADRLGLPSRMNVEIKNGGKIENEGQLWFGAEDDHAVGTEARFTINNGTMDLTGGTILQSNNNLEIDADLAFWFGHDGVSPKNEKWEINFTGPGSIIVDSAGINVYRQDETSTWTGGDPVSYQALWDQGILKANGLSGATTQPADFNTFFSVTGTPGSNNYTLNSTTAPIQTVAWVGGANSNWHAANAWKNNTTNVTGDAAAILGQGNGSDGMNNVDPTQTRARNVVIGGGAQVEYYAPGNGDLRFNQGSSLTVKEGAVLVQETDSTYTANAWTEWDGSNLILDGGTFRRTGNTIKEETGLPDGGGVFMFGSWRSDANADRLGLPSRMNVEIKNGGKIENEGQLWFGAEDDHAVGTEARFTINNGTMDLTGGTILQSNNNLEIDADLAFWFGHDGVSPKNEKWEINFTGPGSIIVDSAGINVYRQDETSTWTGGDPVSYQALWDQGILKANGLSGATTQPADFNTFFSVTGTPGSNNYTLNSLLPADVVGLTGDFNTDGKVDGADFLAWQRGGSPTPLSPGDLATWKANYGASSATAAASTAVGAVPEPTALFSAMVAMCGLGLWRSRR